MSLLFRAVSEMDGTQQHLPNIDINQFNIQIGEYPSFGYLSDDELWKDNVGNCISDTFVVNISEETLYSLTLTENCKFFLMDYHSYEQIHGGYSISDEIVRGGVSTISFFINDETIGEAVVAWPLEDNLCLIINGVVFRKKDGTKH